jgi:hypothetical protein
MSKQKACIWAADPSLMIELYLEVIPREGETIVLHRAMKNVDDEGGEYPLDKECKDNIVKGIRLLVDSIEHVYKEDGSYELNIPCKWENNLDDEN